MTPRHTSSPRGAPANWRTLALAFTLGLQAIALRPASPWLAEAAAKTQDPAVVRRAEALATEAKLLFQQKAYEAAAERFMEAYTMVQNPSLIYNAARAYQEAGLLPKAVALFKAYAGLPDVPEDGKADAAARIATLEAAIRAQEPPPEPTAPPKPEPKPAVVTPPEPVAAPAAPTPTASPEATPGQPATGQPGKTVTRATGPAAQTPQFPWIPAGATAGAAVVSGILYGLALSEAGAAHDMEATLQTTQQSQDYQQHVASATALRGAAVAGAVVTVAAGAWLAWEMFRGGGAAKAASTASGTRMDSWTRWAVLPSRDGAVLAWSVAW